MNDKNDSSVGTYYDLPNTTISEKKSVKTSSGLTPLYILVSITLVFSLVAASLSAITFFRGRSEEGYRISEEEEDTQEDDVVIADEYVIRSTTAISDAYKSGSVDGLDEKEQETLTMASDILSEIITADMTTRYEKEKAVYDWMVANLATDDGMMSVVPSAKENCDNPYGVLKYHNAVCVGYATTFRLFMQMMDIPCKVVHNTDRYHSWDLVQLDDDNWYHTDIYSDVGDVDSYAHFNLCDSMMTEEWDYSYFPEATSLTYNLLFTNAPLLDSADKLPALVRDAYDQHRTTLAVKFEVNLFNAQMALIDYTMSQIENILTDSTYMYWDYSVVDDVYLFTVTIYRYDEEDPTWSYDPSDLSEEDLTKVDQSIQEAFGDLDSVIGSDDETEAVG